MPKKHKKGKQGRPTKLTAEVELALCAALTDGLTFQVAAAAIGVCPASVDRWRKAGKDEVPYGPHSAKRMREFLTNVERAVASCERDMAKVIREAAQGGDWKAAAHFNARRFHERWGSKQRVEIEDVSDRPPVQVWTPRADIAVLTEGEDE